MCVFFLALADHLSFLQVQRTPPLLANHEGGCPFFFTTPGPFRSQMCGAMPGASFLFFLFQVLTVPFSLIPSPLRLALPSPHIALASSRRLCRVAPSPHIAFTTSPLSRRPVASRPRLCRVALSRRPLATCPPFAMPAATCRPFTTRRPSPRVTLVALCADLWGKQRGISEWVGGGDYERGQ